MNFFLGLRLKTTRDTFIPRPETELLVKVCLDTARELSLRGARPRLSLRGGPPKAGRRSNLTHMLDVGTGTGNIAVSLTKLNKTCKIVALEKSQAALEVARENAAHFNVSGRIQFIESDLFDNLKAVKFDIIISNPPFGKKKEVFNRLKELGKPFIMICPSSMINTQYMRQLFCADESPIQIIIPRKRIQFIKMVDGVVDPDQKKACNFDCFYYCWKMDLPRDIVWLQ